MVLGCLRCVGAFRGHCCDDSLAHVVLGKLGLSDALGDGLRRANRDSLRMVQAEAAMAQGDAGGTLAHLKAIAPRWPASNAIWNLHMRAMAMQVGEAHPLWCKRLGTVQTREAVQTAQKSAIW